MLYYSSADALLNAGNDEKPFDGFEGDFDAIIVEVDWDSPSQSERVKRRTVFSPGIEIFKDYLELYSPYVILAIMRSGATCGNRMVDFEPPRPASSRLGRVVNGVDAPVGAIPWQVRKKKKKSDIIYTSSE